MKWIFLPLLLATAAASRAEEFRVYGADDAGRIRLEREAAEVTERLQANLGAWLSANRALFCRPDGSAMPEAEVAAPRAVVVTKAWLAQNDIPLGMRGSLSYDRSSGAATVIYPGAPWADCPLIFVIADVAEPDASAAIGEAALDYQIAIYDILLTAAANRFLYEEFVQAAEKAARTPANGATAKEPLMRAFQVTAKRFGPRLATGALPWNENRHFSEKPWAVELRAEFETAIFNAVRG